MADTAPTTETMKISDVRSGLNKLVNRVYRQETRVIVEKSGIPVAGIVSARDLERLKRLDEENREAWEVLEAMQTPFRDVPSDEIEREAERARVQRERVASETLLEPSSAPVVMLAMRDAGLGALGAIPGVVAPETEPEEEPQCTPTP